MSNKTPFGSWKRLAALFLAAVLMIAGIKPVKNVFASGGYTYTLRIFAGNQGTISGGDVKIYSDLAYGERVAFQMRDVTLNDGSKYYVRGIRESGRDNNTVASLPTITVTQDIDYVVAYGILGSSVAYTVNYVDAAGNTLAPSETYYGNVGDKPVIAYLYIEGYFPNAYNLTRTLSENAAENQITFTYSPVTPETTTAAPTTAAPTAAPTRAATPTSAAATTRAATPANPAAPTTTAAATTTAAPTSPATPTSAATPTAPAAPTAPEAPVEPEQPVSQENSSTQEGQQAPPETQPAPQPVLPQSPDEIPELINLDDNSIPLANFPGQESQTADETGESSSAAVTTAEDTSAVETTKEKPTDSESVGTGDARTPLGSFVTKVMDTIKNKPITALGIGAAIVAAISVLVWFRKRRW